MTILSNLFLANLPIKTHIFCILPKRSKYSDVRQRYAEREYQQKMGK